MKITGNSAKFFGTLLMSTALTVPAFAQIETVVVTAERRAADLQTVPVAVTAFTSELRDKVGIVSIGDMANFTPGMTYSTSTDRVTLRGISRQTNVLSADSGVANYSDGIYQSFAVEAGRSTLDLDRIEVLRGPQGTLYGRNSIGGAINQITPRPTDEFEAEIRANVGAYDYSDLEGVISGPISDNWAARLYGNWERQGLGWAKSIIPGAPEEGNVIDKWYLEGQIQGTIGSKLDIWARAYYTAWANKAGDAGSGSDGWTPSGYPTFEQASGTLTFNPGYGCTALGATATANTTVASASSPLGAAACINPQIKSPWKIAKLGAPTTTSVPAAYFGTTQITYHTNWNFDAKYVGGIEWYRYVLTLPGTTKGGFDAPVSSYTIGAGLPQAIPIGAASPCFNAIFNPSGTCPPLTINPQQSGNYQQQEFFTQNELNLQSTGSGPLTWQAGLYSFVQHESQPVSASMVGQPQIGAPSLGPVEGPFTLPHSPLGNRFFETDPQFNDVSLAAYGQADYKLNDQFKLTAGVRYSYDHKTGTMQSRLVSFPLNSAVLTDTPELTGAFTPALDVTSPPFGIVNYSTCQSGCGPSDPGLIGHATYNPATGFATAHYDKSSSAWTGVVGVDYTPDENTLFYGKYSRGYKGGGFNTGIFSFIQPKPWVDPEHVNAVEVGMKKTFGEWLLLDAAAYYYGYEGMQVPITVAPAFVGGLSTVQFINVPHAISQGFELETILTPIENLTFTTSYSFDDAHISSALVPGLFGALGGVADPADPNSLATGSHPLFTPATCPGNCGIDPYTIGTAPGGVGWIIPQSLKGNRLPNVPRNKVALNLRYDWHMADFGILTPSITYTWRDSQYGTIFTRSYNKSPSWDQWDGRVSFASPDGHWNFIVYGRNIGNHIGYDTGAVGTRLAGSINRSCAGAPLAGGGALGGSCFFVQGLAGPTTPHPTGYNAVTNEGPFGTVSTYSVTPPETWGVQLQFRL